MWRHLWSVRQNGVPGLPSLMTHNIVPISGRSFVYIYFLFKPKRCSTVWLTYIFSYLEYIIVEFRTSIWDCICSQCSKIFDQLLILDQVVFTQVLFNQVVFNQVVFDQVVFDQVVFDQVVFDQVVFDQVVFLLRSTVPAFKALIYARY